MDNTSSEDRNHGKKYVVFFDLDRTITGEISGKALVRMAWKKRLISGADLLNAFWLYLLYRIKLRDPIRVIEDMVGWVRGRSEAEMESLCSDVCREVLLPSVFTEAIKAIKFHKENNSDVVILSSALNLICAEVSEKLGMNGYICSYLEAKDGYFTGRSAGGLCFAEEKLIRLKAYCRKNTMNPEDSWYYGDSFSDLPVLDAVGNPVCVNPDRKLTKVARRRDWRIVTWIH
jgi:HAD superfamily hydrolase (TIGR01490 family)